MSPRARYVSRDAIDSLRSNIARTYVIAAAVSNYDHLPYLSGPAQDLEMVTEIFANNDAISLYQNKFRALPNPTVDQFRESLLNFAWDRSARGDILVIYFSGHGAVFQNGTFGFCLRDSIARPNEGGILPLSVISFVDVVQTLSSVDIFPVFIIDACFSGTTAPQGSSVVTSTMQDTLQSHLAGSYALLASSGSDIVSFDTPFGGVFTRSLHAIMVNGLNNDEGRHLPFITLRDIEVPLQEHLTKSGHPLSRCHIGAGLPSVPIARNPTFRPDSETFVPYMKQIVELLWNNGFPREAALKEILNVVGPGAYANHSKLSRKPWGLLEDGPNNSTRRLTEKGKKFAQGQERIPRRIIRDAVTWEWVADDRAEWVSISDI